MIAIDKLPTKRRLSGADYHPREVIETLGVTQQAFADARYAWSKWGSVAGMFTGALASHPRACRPAG